MIHSTGVSLVAPIYCRVSRVITGNRIRPPTHHRRRTNRILHIHIGPASAIKAQNIQSRQIAQTHIRQTCQPRSASHKPGQPRSIPNELRRRQVAGHRHMPRRRHTRRISRAANIPPRCFPKTHPRATDPHRAGDEDQIRPMLRLGKADLRDTNQAAQDSRPENAHVRQPHAAE